MIDSALSTTTGEINTNGNDYGNCSGDGYDSGTDGDDDTMGNRCGGNATGIGGTADDNEDDGGSNNDDDADDGGDDGNCYVHCVHRSGGYLTHTNTPPAISEDKSIACQHRHEAYCRTALSSDFTIDLCIIIVFVLAGPPSPFAFENEDGFVALGDLNMWHD